MSPPITSGDAMAKRYEFKPDRPRSGMLSKLILSPIQRRSLLKWTLYALVLVALSVLQDVLFSRVRLFGATTELVPCGIFLICLLEGLERGSVFSLVAALVYLFAGNSESYYIVVFIPAISIFITAFRQSYLQHGFGAAMLCTAVAMLLYELAVCFITIFLGLNLWRSLFRFLMTAALSLPAMPILYPILLSIGGGDTWNE